MTSSASIYRTWLDKLSGTLGAAFLLILALGGAGDLFARQEASIQSGAAEKAPVIDGKIESEEWASSTQQKISLKVIFLEQKKEDTRSATLNWMNSANGLYVALKIEDKTEQESLNPILMDCAVLALQKNGDESDRKVVGPGLYRDKQFRGVGKGEIDDPVQDGVAAITRADGLVSIEWAIPLRSKDKTDWTAKPGDTVRLNLVYFDGLQLPLTKSGIGGLFGADLNSTKNWGELKLADNVQDDGGTAFRAGADKIIAELRRVWGSGVKFDEPKTLPNTSPPSVWVNFEHEYLDFHGEEKSCKGKLFLPTKFDFSKKYPLYFVAGYEAPENGIVGLVSDGWIVCSPRDLETNPLVRGINSDIARLHLARKLTWVDDRKVTIAGGSEGGWMTLHLCAESFPIAGGVPDVPPINWGYNAAYFFKQLELVGPEQAGGTPRVPALSAVGTALKPSVDVYGPDFGSETWYASSPIAHLDSITCPISVVWSTADVLVPINQIGAEWIRSGKGGNFPNGFTMVPKELVDSPRVTETLLGSLNKDHYELFSVVVPTDTRRQNNPNATGKVVSFDLQRSKTKQWSITIIDEGEPLFDVDHRKYAFQVSHKAFLENSKRGEIGIEQLTEPKLIRLLKRYSGVEALPSELKHLQKADDEREDVVRGLSTYVSISEEHRKRFEELYGKLPADSPKLEAKDYESILK